MDAQLLPDAAGVPPDARRAPVAIIDIGSNSVRLVVYDGQTRAPTPLFNEKLMCGLGRDLATTGRLPEDGVERAVAALARFRVLCRTLRVSSVRVLATAAARIAENGPAFLARAEQACGQPVELLTGGREAELSALGVISGSWEPDGIVGDLGGGSLELIEVDGARIGDGITLPLGGLMLKGRAGGSTKAAAKIVRQELAASPQLARLRGRTFFAVGGTWRAIARLQMTERGYPLHVMHGYRLEAQRGGYLEMVERTSPAALKALESVAEARRPLLVYGAVLLDEIIRIGEPREVAISALGVREGLLFESLPPEERSIDPLLAASGELNALRSRCPEHGEELQSWTDEFMRSLGVSETALERRLRHAACLLSDVGWRAHPDYRGEQSVAAIGHASLLGVEHPGRAYLALAVFFRHEGLSSSGPSAGLVSIAGTRLVELARTLAALLRVAYPISVAMSGVLPRTPVSVDGGEIVLRLPPDLAPLASERLANRMRALGRLLERPARIVTG